MATTTIAPAKTDATTSERMRKKPRLSPSSSSSTAASASTATITASSASSSRLKSGLLPPTVSTSRLHYAFGSRRPIAGKENTPVNASVPVSKPTKATEPLKKAEQENGSKSALKRRPKRRQSTEAAKPPPHPSAPSTPASSDVDAMTLADEAAVKQHTTPPTNKTVPVILSPVKPVRFEVTTATDPDFWKCRQEFARKAMVQLKDLDARLNALAESSSLPSLL